MGPEAAGQGSGGKSASGGHMTPIPVSSRVWIGLVVARSLPCSRSSCTRRRPFPPWRWVGWPWPSCSRFRCGPSRTSRQGAGYPADRCGHARLDLSWFFFLVPLLIEQLGALAEDHAHRQQRQPALARGYKRAERAPAGTRLGSRGVRQEAGHRPLRPRPEPYREPAKEPPRVYPQGFQLRGDALRHNLRRDLPPGGRAQSEGGPSFHRRRPRPVGSLRRLALALPRGLVFVVMIQGVLAAGALYLLGVPYAILLSACGFRSRRSSPTSAPSWGVYRLS